MAQKAANIIKKRCQTCGAVFRYKDTKRNATRAYCSGFCAKRANGLKNVGRKLSEETKNKISKSLSGEGNPFFGKKHTKATCRKISKSNKGKRTGENHQNYRPIKDRFLENIKIAANGCWEWVGWFRSKGKKGFYGGIKSGGLSVLAHRTSYEVFKGAIPIGLNVLHACDNTRCVNPDHLFLGTHADNMKDMALKNRGTSGERSPKSPLKNSDVLEIRSLSGKMLHRDIAKKFNVSTSSITNIINRKNWRHI